MPPAKFIPSLIPKCRIRVARTLLSKGLETAVALLPIQSVQMYRMNIIYKSVERKPALKRFVARWSQRRKVV